jgi:hypothetical protein
VEGHSLPRRFVALACNAIALLLPAAALAGESAETAAGYLRTVTVRWTAPGGDGNTGRAGLYDLRYSPFPITEHNFKYAIRVPGLDSPAEAGMVQTATIHDLYRSVGYYLAIRTADRHGNWSAISNVIFVSPSSVGTGGLLGSPTLDFASPRPNPARSTTRCTFTLPAGMQVDIDVYDVAGRRVHALAHGWREPGVHDLEWDLRGEAGVRLAPGLYLVRARLGNKVWSRRLTIAG